ncbi:MAG TPA: DNA glycosylase [Chloroflexota bacterium]|nr:DNA glycosylase [Chloroflexota bacterium]
MLNRWGRVDVPLGGEPLSLTQTLGCGQAFRWWKGAGESWHGVAAGRVWQLEVIGDCLRADMSPAMPTQAATEFLIRYFSLDLPSREIRARVSVAHPKAAEAAEQFAGLRILRQDPLETVLTFAIATATNVPRVTRSVAELCRRFGEPIGDLGGVTSHAFPTTAQILGAPSEVLFRECNLAYRARSIQGVAQAIETRPSGWIEMLKKLPYLEAHAALDALPGYGPKVSDCACLFGLGFFEAVPVDVHVWAIAHELFGEDIPTRTLTVKTYRKIGDRFRDLFGPWAGWAQQYLFCARRAVPVKERFRPR